MRNVMISMLIVAALAVGACVFSVRTVGQACGEMEMLRLEAQALCEHEQTGQAAECVQRMLGLWQRKAPLLEMVLAHSVVADMTGALIEARADLLAGEADEFMGDMVLLGELLRRLEADEQLHLSNILTIC